MANRMDSEIIEYNEDGSTTTTTIVTQYPVTGKQKAAAFAALGGLLMAPVLPVFGVVLAEKISQHRENRRQRKLEVAK